MCEEQQTKIAILIAEAIWRHANKLVEQQMITSTESTTTQDEVTLSNNKDADDES